MGLMNITNTATGSIVALVVILSLFLGFIMGANQTKVVDASVIEKMESVTLTRMIEDCFNQDDKYINSTYLDTLQGNLCDLCNICEPDVKAKLTDMNNGKEYNFGYTGDELYSHANYVNIEDEGNLHWVRLDVEVKSE